MTILVRHAVLVLVMVLVYPMVLLAAGPVSSTAAAPTLSEGTANTFSGDLGGNLRVTNGTCLSGESACIGTSPDSYIMTTGGVVRSKTVASGMLVGGDGTMTGVATVPTGSKTFQGIITGTGAITQTQKLYGGFANPLTTTNGELLCTLTLSGTTETSLTCPVVTANFPYYAVLTSGTTGTSATGVMKVGY